MFQVICSRKMPIIEEYEFLDWTDPWGIQYLNFLNSWDKAVLQGPREEIQVASKIHKWERPIASRSWKSSGALPSLSRRHSNKPNYQSSVKMQWDLRGLVQCTFHASFVRDATGKYPVSKLGTFLPIHEFMSKCALMDPPGHSLTHSGS